MNGTQGVHGGAGAPDWLAGLAEVTAAVRPADPADVAETVGPTSLADVAETIRPAGPADVAQTVRPAGPADVAALSDFFAGLSPQSRYMRFFVPVTPNPDLLRMLGGGPANVDALVATQGGVIIGHAMTVDRIGHRGVLVADVGVVVADAWQGRGVGSALVRALITRAHARGVTLLEMDVMHANQRVLAMIEHYWPAASTDDGADYLSIRVPLSEHGEQPRAA